MPGRLFGVGVGPGDPELLTLKATRAIHDADVIAYPSARHGKSVARRIAAPYLRADHLEVLLRFPVTTELTSHPGGYEAALFAFYDEASEELAVHLDAGRDVAILCEGDPFFYGSYMYFHERLAPRYETTVIPAVTAFSAAAAAAGTPLVKRDDVFMALPGTLPQEQLAARLRSADAAVVMKLGRTFPKVVEAAAEAGVAERGVYVERASAPEQRIVPLEEVEGSVPYMSLVLVPTTQVHRSGDAAASAAAGSVAVVGLGPAGPEWLTPEARAELAEATEIVGYKTYVDRVPGRVGQTRHATDNRVEADRARHALELAAAGRRVAVVSSGDPGIFAMAAAVMEQLEAGSFGGVDVRVVPGLSAMQAAAARVGAPLGHDFCVLSLSDVLKPWEVIERRLEAVAAADLALAVYNPRSKTRPTQLEEARAVLLRHRAPETVVVLARAVGAPSETITVTTLGAFDAEAVDMRTLLLVGSSQTRVFGDGNGAGPVRVYTPRRYPA
ncbi:precorrin-2 C(20)-methyltransferase [Conexibacter sp. JD483]|uniref:precorrin-2 C(20)-methyltransferase n=1 Tax=unclassified Conexibacter TaxID=2627773 RepID=UPI0027291DA6|nr:MULTISPECIES: precorrin-2 C(20)-methyltransferase [unclassified Conexibacter]MDO8189341.1 precorrin-2 C(20)-methyltransferase [Conexibacter sp. CPCC 205706]MDO8201400.1 precorrin-2 C(20)-methyltransferase [Conexibacter sp. CPCC 205762]MDR9372394.1 precorrin-2 C(20)-methyltransferase [Conexibacter sp. JD483]